MKLLYSFPENFPNMVIVTWLRDDVIVGTLFLTLTEFNWVLFDIAHDPNFTVERAKK